MANHANTKKAARQAEKKRVHNKYYAKTTRNLIAKLRKLGDKKEASELLPTVSSEIDKLVKRNLFHKNKAANLKSKLTKHVNSL